MPSKNQKATTSRPVKGRRRCRSGDLRACNAWAMDILVSLHMTIGGQV